MIGQAQRIIELQEVFKLNVKGSRSVPVIAFTSGKGGTGKTFLSLNIAYQLAKLNKKVLLVDFDLNFANIHVMLNIIPKLTLFQFFNMENKLSDIIFEYSGNLHFIFGFSGFESKTFDFSGLSSFWKQLDSISGEYDFILIDTSSGGSPETIEVLNESDLCIIVANPEPTSVMDAYAVIKLLNQKDKKPALEVLINKILSDKDASTAFQNLKNAVNHFLSVDISCIGYFPFDEEVMKSVMTQEILLQKNSGQKNNIYIKTLAEKIIKNTQLVNNNHL